MPARPVIVHRRGTDVGVAGSFFHEFDRDACVEGGGDESRPGGVRNDRTGETGGSTVASEEIGKLLPAQMLPRGRIRVSVSPKAGREGKKEGRSGVYTVTGGVQIGSDRIHAFLVNRQDALLPTFSQKAQHVVTLILIKIPDPQSADFRDARAGEQKHL